MNIKNSIVALLISFIPLTIISMEPQKPEKSLFLKEITPQEYLLQIEHGLYGPIIAQQLHEIHSAIYTPSPTEQPSNLYALLAHLVIFVSGKKGAHTPDNIRNLMISQIQAKYRMLLDYKERGLVQMPSMSPEDLGQQPFVSGE